MTIITENAAYTPTLRIWTDGQGYSPDMLPELWSDIGYDHDHDEDGNWLMTEADFREAMEWWQAKCEEANSAPVDDESEEVISNPGDGMEWVLDF